MIFRPYDIDEAMHRRITMVLEYKEPNYAMRKQIWDNFLQGHTDQSPAKNNGKNHNSEKESALLGGKLQLSSDVDTSILAIKYELTGGFIKNAVLSALLSALSRDRKNPIISQQVRVMIYTKHYLLHILVSINFFVIELQHGHL